MGEYITRIRTADGDKQIDYEALANKPTTFPPSTHTHAESDVTELATDLAAKLPKSGGTMTGALTLSGAPTDDLHAATKKYVDDNSGGGGGLSPKTDLTNISVGTISMSQSLNYCITSFISGANKVLVVAANADGAASDYAAYSLNGGSSWTTKTMPSSQIWCGIVSTAGGLLVVAKGTNTVAMTGSYMMGWQTATVGSTPFVDPYVFWDGTRTIIADPPTGQVFTSTSVFGFTAGTMPTASAGFSSIAKSNNGRLIGAVPGVGLYKSDDHGQTWDKISLTVGDIPQDTNVKSVACNGTVWIANRASGSQYYYSTDGDTWVSKNGHYVGQTSGAIAVMDGAFYADTGSYSSVSSDGVTWSTNTDQPSMGVVWDRWTYIGGVLYVCPTASGTTLKSGAVITRTYLIDEDGNEVVLGESGGEAPVYASYVRGTYTGTGSTQTIAVPASVKFAAIEWGDYTFTGGMLICAQGWDAPAYGSVNPVFISIVHGASVAAKMLSVSGQTGLLTINDADFYQSGKVYTYLLLV